MKSAWINYNGVDHLLLPAKLSKCAIFPSQLTFISSTLLAGNISHKKAPFPQETND